MPPPSHHDFEVSIVQHHPDFQRKPIDPAVLDRLAARFGGQFQTGEAVRALGERARHELLDPWSWPLDEGWESWRPPPGWSEPLTLPDLPSVVEARSRA